MFRGWQGKVTELHQCSMIVQKVPCLGVLGIAYLWESFRGSRPEIRWLRSFYSLLDFIAATIGMMNIRRGSHASVEIPFMWKVKTPAIMNQLSSLLQPRCRHQAEYKVILLSDRLVQFASECVQTLCFVFNNYGPKIFHVYGHFVFEHNLQVP